MEKEQHENSRRDKKLLAKRVLSREGRSLETTSLFRGDDTEFLPGTRMICG
jgi:hypothetical protein